MILTGTGTNSYGVRKPHIITSELIIISAKYGTCTCKIMYD